MFEGTNTARQQEGNIKQNPERRKKIWLYMQKTANVRVGGKFEKKVKDKQKPEEDKKTTSTA